MVLQRVPKIVGVCVRAGTMDKTIKVRTAKQRMDPYFKTFFKIWPTYLVHDPYNSCRTGDVIQFQRFPIGSKSKRVRHAVTEILAAFGPRLEDRPPVMSKKEQEARLREMEERQIARKERKDTAKRETAIERISLRLHNRQISEGDTLPQPTANA